MDQRKKKYLCMMVIAWLTTGMAAAPTYGMTEAGGGTVQSNVSEVDVEEQATQENQTGEEILSPVLLAHLRSGDMNGASLLTADLSETPILDTGSNNQVSATADQDNVVLYGNNNIIEYSKSSVIIGNSITAKSSPNSVFMGNGIEVYGIADSGIVVGPGGSMPDPDRGKGNVAVGQNILVGTSQFASAGTVALGEDIHLQGNYSIGLGQGSKVYGTNSIGLGHNVQIGTDEDHIDSADNSVAIGTNSSIQGSYSTALGTDSSIDGSRNDALGNGSIVIGDDSTALGYGSQIYYANESLAIGSGAKISDPSAVPPEEGKAATITTGASAMGVQSSVGKAANYSMALGYQSAIGDGTVNSIALGSGASVAESTKDVSTSQSMALGYESSIKAGAGNSVALGVQSSVGIGSDKSTVLGNESTIGEDSGSSATLGYRSNIGNKAKWSLALGSDASIKDNAEKSTAVGYGTSIGAGTRYAVALGGSAFVGANSEHSMALGMSSRIEDNTQYAIALGGQSGVAAGGNYSMALGYQSRILEGADFAVAAGNMASIGASSRWAVAMGYQSIVGNGASGAMALGGGAVVGAASSFSSALGYLATIADGVTFSVALGARSAIGTGADTSMALGGYSLIGADAIRSTAVGYLTEIGQGAEGAITLGAGSSIGKLAKDESPEGKASPFAMALGYQSKVGTAASESTAVGYKAVIGDGVKNAVAMGAYSRVAQSDLLTADNWTAKGEWDAQIDSEYGVVSVGSSAGDQTVQRRVINVANGRISADSTDAINGSQLHAVKTEVESGHTAVTVNGDTTAPTDGTTYTEGNLQLKKTTVDGKDTYDVKLNDMLDLGAAGSLSINGKTYVNNNGLNANGQKITNVAAGTEDTDAVNFGQLKDLGIGTAQPVSVTVNEGMAAPEGGIYNAKGNLQLKKTDNGGQLEYDVKLNDKVVLGTDTDKQIVMDGTKGLITAGGTVKLGSQEFVHKEINESGWFLTGLGNTTFAISNGGYKNYEGSHRAATEGQLYDAFDFLDKKIDGITIDGDKNINVDKKPETPGGTGSTGGGTESGQTPKPSPGWDVTMSDTPTFGGGADGTDKTKPGSVTVVGSHGNITVNEGDKGTVSGLSNLEWDRTKANTDVSEGGYKHSSNAATESQLQQAMESTVQYDVDKNGNINKDSITLAGGNGGTGIHNVADGKVSADSKDAVNGSQLHGVQQQVTNNTTAITNIGNGIHKLDRRINKVGAGAAALAALHPLDFDPDDKWDFAAGYGNYASANAAAVGAYYRPNEDTMFSVGGSFGNGENMVNAGVSFKLGQGNHVSTSRVAMAKEIISLRKELEELKSAMLDAHTGKTLDTSKLQLFPDVPENHWAYEYVAVLAGNGMIKGYPDGHFSGDRPMTRYEFAAMLYRSMVEGAVLSDRLLTEFQPELELIRVDVISKDKEGRPTIERVRVKK